MTYKSNILSDTITIKEIVTVHYFEYQSDFIFAGESHDFWEFLCVDKGEVNVTAGKRTLSLQRGDIIFHPPGEFHSLCANRRIAPNLVVVSFPCHSPAMDFFRNKVLSIDNAERSLLGQLITVAGETFKGRLDDPYQTYMPKKETVPSGSEQFIRLYLELFLLRLLCRYSDPHSAPKQTDMSIRRKQDEVYHRVIDYLSEHISDRLTLDRICRETLTSSSQIQGLIHQKHNCGVIELFNQMKVSEAKQLIRDNHLNFTGIAEKLGYTSIHYFSRQFKQSTGMTPSEYSSSIKSLAKVPDSGRGPFKPSAFTSPSGADADISLW